MRKLITAVPLLVLFLVLTDLNAQQDSEGPADSDNVAAMQAIENTWSDALLKRDQYALEAVLGAGFVDISPDGEVTTRNQQIARLFLHDTEAISFVQKVASARLFGDIAIVNGTYILRYARDGHTIDDKGIFTHVFQKSHSRWQCINSQRTFVVEQGASGKKPSSLPFHLPGSHTAATPQSSTGPVQKAPPSIPSTNRQP